MQSMSLCHIDNETESLDANRIEKDIWLKRDTKPWNVEYIFGLGKDGLSSYKGRESELIGKTGKEQAFLSCGSCKDTEFWNGNVEYKIYCPKGTPAIYGEPFSAFGGEVMKGNTEDFGLNWDGVKKPKDLTRTRCYYNEEQSLKLKMQNMMGEGGKSNWNSKDLMFKIV